MAEDTAEKTYELLKPWGFLVARDKLTTPRSVGQLLVARGIAKEIEIEPRGGKDETNKAFQSPPKTKKK